MNVSEFISKDKSELLCISCNNNKLSRIFSSFSSKIELRKDDIIDGARKEAKAIVKKIKSGDTKAIRNIYGEK